MRVISGSAKGRKLKSVPGPSTRPITDRGKVALFDILAPDVPDSLVLDLFAGTGGVGIEALSRGARRAVFVDIDPKSVTTIRENLKTTQLEDRASVIRSDSFRFLERAEHEAFDLIYIAPPQYHGLWIKALEIIDRHQNWLSPDGLAIVQIDPKEIRDIPLAHIKEFDRRRYGNTLLWFFEKPAD
ncbi:MAG: 16S rRNA (guanine(966)-N(2))-methyltransferase RsmD [Chloroflexi bacterium RBG_13_60_9]|nr:MAG: 16S rRNA (guanine(966)-N(2))-methyltransferase RsmD [Chloroflexi bacterium RBG_13_60_9]